MVADLERLPLVASGTRPFAGVAALRGLPPKEAAPPQSQPSEGAWWVGLALDCALNWRQAAMRMTVEVGVACAGDSDISIAGCPTLLASIPAGDHRLRSSTGPTMPEVPGDNFYLGLSKTVLTPGSDTPCWWTALPVWMLLLPTIVVIASSRCAEGLVRATLEID